MLLRYAFVFFAVAFLAAVLGLGGVATGAAQIGTILFFVFLLIAAITFVAALVRK